jgi:hypothetical protein
MFYAINILVSVGGFQRGGFQRNFLINSIPIPLPNTILYFLIISKNNKKY